MAGVGGVEAQHGQRSRLSHWPENSGYLHLGLNMLRLERCSRLHFEKVEALLLMMSGGRHVAIQHLRNHSQ